MGSPDITNLPHYTWDDYQNWDGDWELIDGIAYAMSPAPSILHQSISQKIATQFELALDFCKACQALLPVDWKIDDDTVVQPDNLIVCGDITGNYLTKAPQLIVEILSKSTEQKDKSAKFKLYEKEGVKYYLIVDPQSQVVKVYDLFEGRYIKRLDASNELLDFEIMGCNIQVDLVKIWP
jgi:Uma2 family endonuclease